MIAVCDLSKHLDDEQRSNLLDLVGSHDPERVEQGLDLVRALSEKHTIRREDLFAPIRGYQPWRYARLACCVEWVEVYTHIPGENSAEPFCQPMKREGCTRSDAIAHLLDRINPGLFGENLRKTSSRAARGLMRKRLKAEAKMAPEPARFWLKAMHEALGESSVENGRYHFMSLDWCRAMARLHGLDLPGAEYSHEHLMVLHRVWNEEVRHRFLGWRLGFGEPTPLKATPPPPPHRQVGLFGGGR